MASSNTPATPGAAININQIQSQRGTKAVFALLIGASFWGIVWYPFRLLHQAGLNGGWASALTYTIAGLIGLAFLWRQCGDWKKAPWSIFLLALTAGLCNVSYVIGVTEGEVMRITLLFYLSPLWTVPLAYWILNESLDLKGAFVMTLAIVGALIMLWRPEFGAPVPANRAEWLGLLAGITFALNNVLVRKMSGVSVATKSMAIWFGVALVGLAVSLADKPPPSLTLSSWMIVLTIGVILVAMSLAIQYGLSNLGANISSVVMLFELAVACAASYWLTEERLRVQDWIGGAIICTTSVIAVWQHSKIAVGPTGMRPNGLHDDKT